MHGIKGDFVEIYIGESRKPGFISRKLYHDYTLAF